MERGRIIVNNTDYTGSFVTPNPSEPPTKDLNTLEIEGEVFNIAGSGGGGVGDITNYYGVFVDTQNVILPETKYTDGESYTSTQDCYGFIFYQLGSGRTQITLDGVDLVNVNQAPSANSYIAVSLAKGQTLNFISTFNGSFYLTVYGAKSGDRIPALIQNAQIYSEDERVVGVWIDNKPLYQKTFILNQTISNYQWSENILGTLGSGIEIKKYDGYLGINNEGYPTLPIDWCRSSTSYSTTNTSSNSDDLSIRPNIDGVSSVQVIYVTIQYTKTTDVAGSGEYNTLGVPNVHYDGNERVIGTWFGETLYEKTLVIHNESTVSSTTTITTIDSTFKVKNWKAFAIEYGVNYQIPYVAGSGSASFYFRENGNVDFTITNTSFAAGSDFYITIEYTKSTT